jgi:hypothetical protein
MIVESGTEPGDPLGDTTPSSRDWLPRRCARPLPPTPHADDRARDGSSAREILWGLCGALAVRQAGGLADLDQVSVWISHVAADLSASRSIAV